MVARVTTEVPTVTMARTLAPAPQPSFMIHENLEERHQTVGGEGFYIPPKHSGAFVHAMEDVVDAHHLPYDAQRPLPHSSRLRGTVSGGS